MTTTPRISKQLKILRKSPQQIHDALEALTFEQRLKYNDRCKLTTLPDEMIVRSLVNLLKLNLSNNALHELPEWISKLKLESLNVSKNKFEQVPEVVLSLTELKTLSFSDNLLRGIPDKISQLSMLKSLDLRGCRLHSLPVTPMKTLAQLEMLFLDDNKFPDGCNRTGNTALKVAMLLDELGAVDLETKPSFVARLREANEINISAMPVFKWQAVLEDLGNVDIDAFWFPCMEQLAATDAAEDMVLKSPADAAAIENRGIFRAKLLEYLRGFHAKAEEVSQLLVKRVQVFSAGGFSPGESGLHMDALIERAASARRAAVDQEVHRVSLYSRLASFCKFGSRSGPEPSEDIDPAALLSEAQIALEAEITLKAEFEYRVEEASSKGEAAGRRNALEQLTSHRKMLSVISARMVELERTGFSEANMKQVIGELKVATRELKRAKIRLKFAQDMAASASDGEDDEVMHDVAEAGAAVPPARARYERAVEAVLVLKRNGYPELACPSVYFGDPLKDVPTVPYSDLTRLTQLKEIGNGGASDVYLAKMPGLGNVAFKRFRAQQSVSNKDQLKQEANIMYALRSPRIIQLLGVCLDDQQRGLILEYAPGGSLFTMLFKDKVVLTQEQVLSMGANVIEGLMYLHSHKVLHLDLKSDNILLDERRVSAKIADFGTSRIKRDTLQFTKVLGTVGFMAPEALLMPPDHDTPCDVYSFGMLLFEMCTNRVPFQDMSHHVTAVAIRDGQRPDVSGMEEPFLSVARACWQHEAAQRPTATRLMGMFVDRQLQCMVCLEPFFPSEGILCSEDSSHFICCKCIDGALHSSIGRNQAMPDSSMLCEGRRCPGGRFQFDSFARYASSRVLSAWSSAVFRLREKQLMLDHEKEKEALRQSLIHKTVAQAKADLIGVKIRKQFEMTCPVCGIAVSYENGCLALGCGDDRCQAKFCAYCWEVSPNRSAAHSHLSHCQYNFRKPDWFGGDDPMKTWERAQKLRHIRAMRVLINEVIPPDILHLVLDSNQEFFAEHGIVKTDLINYE